MLDTLDLSLKVSKGNFGKLRAGRMVRLGEMQRALREAQIPVIIIFEGWHGSGKGIIINALVQAMDPRGFKVYTGYLPNDEERSKPFFWQFWNKLPGKGNISIFDRSWYGQIVSKTTEKGIGEGYASTAYSDVNSFERLLTDDNHIIIKFFTHISEKAHKQRVKASGKALGKDMRPTTDDWKEVALYKTLVPVYEEIISKTDTAVAPWVAVEAEDERYAQLKVLDYIISIFEKKLAERELEETTKLRTVKTNMNAKTDKYAENSFFFSVLSKTDLKKTVEKDEYQKKMTAYQEEIRILQYKLFRENIPTVIVFEGWDAAGKGGAIKRVTANMDPRGYYVTPISAPSFMDRNYNYLWRFWKEMPSQGMVAIFDRSWYGRVMVERVEGFAREEEWRRAYREINEMEDHLLNSGNLLFKFWLHIGKQEQLRRFEARQNNPLKLWKITEEDWRNRDKWDEYELAVNEMLFRTSTIQAPWTIVEAECKFYGRLKVIKTIIDGMKARIKQ